MCFKVITNPQGTLVPYHNINAKSLFNDKLTTYISYVYIYFNTHAVMYR